VERKHGASSATNRTAKVQSGNTLSKLAEANNTSVAAIKRANNLTSDRIRVGQELIMPAVAANDEAADFTGRQRWVYQELRDRKVALFIDKLPEGVWQIRYDLRAEVPGQFHALPVLGHAMYVPEIRCNGAEIRVNVQDAN
jgi:LysM repeat protein